MKSLVFSSYTNAYTIYKGTQSLGFNTATADSLATFPIPTKAGATKADWLFFTEEASLRRALLGELEGNFLPSQFPLHLLDNKWEFVNWLKEQRLVKVPKQWSLAEREQVAYPCLLKAKHSWVGLINLPRGWLCRSAKEIEDRLIYIKSQGFDSKHFFLQEWFGSTQCRVISVCGFHDSKKNYRNLVAVVERIFASEKVLSGSAAVETIDDEWLLTLNATAILNRLDFIGPYEMEFLVHGDNVLFLELNPRFWMQHAIFLKNGNGLIKRYLKLDREQDHLLNKINDVIWIDTVQLVFSIARFRIKFLMFAIKKLCKKNKQVIMWPGLPLSFYIFFRRIFLKYLRIILNKKNLNHTNF
jgi:hypothetical protein